MAAPLPPDEATRLATLRRYRILDTEAEPGFDDLAFLAAQVCDAPIALLSLVDASRQWFKSRIGFEVGEVDRDLAFCAHAILGRGLFVVRDASLDPRFRENPLVTSGARFRFYAGAPLVAPDGAALGTLCVIDHVPRDLSPEQGRALEALARQVMALFDLRLKHLEEREHLEGRLRDASARTRRVTDQLPVALWTVDADLRFTSSQGGALGALDMVPDQVVGMSVPELLEVRDEAAPPIAAHRQALAGKAATFTAGFRGREFDAHVEPLVREGRVVGAIGLALDVTERRRAEQGLREATAWRSAVLDAALDAIVVMDEDGRVREFNPAAERTFGHRREEAVGRPMADLLIPPAHRDAHRAGLARYLATGRAAILGQHLELPALRADGSEITVELAITRLPVEGSALFVGFMRDLTERKRAERLQAGYTRILALANTASDIGDVYRGTHAIIRELMRAENFYIALHDPESGRLSFPYFVDEYDPPPDPKPLGRGLTEYVLRSGRPLLATAEAFAEMVGRGEVDEIGASSVDWLGVPLVTRGRTIGVLAVQTYAGGHRYTPADEGVLSFVSHAVALAVERRIAEDGVRLREERFRALVEHAADGIALLDADGIVTWLGPSTTRLLGYSPDFVGRSGFEPMHRDDQVRVRQVFGDLLRRPGESEELRYRTLHRDGSSRWIEATATNLLGLKAVGAVVINFRDVTDRHREASALAVSEQRYRRLFERSLAGIVRTTPDGRILDCNASFARMLGYAGREELLERSAWDLYFDPRDRVEVVAASLHERVLSGREVHLRSRTGDDVWVIVNENVVEEGEATGTTAIESTVVDITQRRQAEEQTRRLAEMKSNFMIVTSHEMRTPLTIAGGYLELLAALGPLTPGQADAVRRCEGAVARMTRAIGEFHAMVQLEQGRLVLRSAPVDLSSLTREVLDELRPFGERRRQRLALEAHDGLPALVGDAERLRTALLEVVGNAIKFTPDGGEVRLRLDHADGAQHLVVEDTGIGMTASQCGDVFTPFHTGVDPRHHRSGTFEFGTRGNGLGLAIVRGYVEAHGGRVWAESAGPGRGSAFHLLLPGPDGPPRS